MKIDYLRYFITLANSTSISQAAETLYISNQQLNRIISALEEEVGAVLFLRSNKGIKLTEDGRELLQYAKNIVKEYTAMTNHFYQKRNQQTNTAIYGEVSLFLPPCFALYASDIINSLRKIAPNIQPRIYEKNTQLNVNYFDEQALCFWAKEILPEDLILNNSCKLQFIHFDDSPNFIVYNQTTHTQIPTPDEISISFAHIYNAALKNRLFLSNIYQILDSVSDNNDIAAFPSFVLPKIKNEYPELSFVLRPETSPLSIVYQETHTLSEADQVVINFMKSFIQNQHLLAKPML